MTPDQLKLAMNKAVDSDRGRGGTARILLGAVLFSVIGLGAYSWMADPFLPTPEYHAAIEAKALTLAAGLAVFMAFIGIVMPAHPSNPRGSKFAIVPVLAAFGIFAPDIAMKGAPAFHAGLLRAPETTQTVTVVEEGRLIRRKRCNRTAQVAPVGAPDYSVTICGIPVSIHRNLEAGDRLVLTGQTTRFGMRYQSIAEGAKRAPDPEALATAGGAAPCTSNGLICAIRAKHPEYADLSDQEMLSRISPRELIQYGN